MRISEVSINDLEEILNLEEGVFKKDAFSRDLMKKLIDKNMFFLKIDKGNLRKKLIGFVIIVKEQDQANIINFLIHPKYQHQGYGTYLLQASILKINEQKDIKKIILNVKIDNISAINLYKQFDFQIKEKINNYYSSGESSFLMVLNL